MSRVFELWERLGRKTVYRSNGPTTCRSGEKSAISADSAPRAGNPIMTIRFAYRGRFRRAMPVRFCCMDAPTHADDCVGLTRARLIRYSGIGRFWVFSLVRA